MMRIAFGTSLIASCTLIATALATFHNPIVCCRSGIVCTTRRPNGSSELFCSSNHQPNNCKLQQSSTTSRRELLRSTIRNVPIYIIAALTSSVIIAPVAPSSAISPQEAASSYDKFASNYDTLDGGSAADILGINEARGKVIGMAKGKVLEIGAGTGLNLDKYKFASTPNGRDGVSSLTLLDISDGMLVESKKKVMAMKDIPSFVEIKFIQADATSSNMVELFGRGTFDTVVDTFSLCVMGRTGAQKCLEQMRDVVKTEAEGGETYREQSIPHVKCNFPPFYPISLYLAQY